MLSLAALQITVPFAGSAFQYYAIFVPLAVLGYLALFFLPILLKIKSKEILALLRLAWIGWTALAIVSTLIFIFSL